MIGSSSTGDGVLDALARGQLAGQAERQLVRVDRVERAVVQRRLEVDHRVAGDRALLGDVAHALLDARPELARHRAADDACVANSTPAPGIGLDLEPDVAELAAAAGLLLVPALGLGLASGSSRGTGCAAIA